MKQRLAPPSSHLAAGSEGSRGTAGFGLKGQPGSGSWTGSRTFSALLAVMNPLHTANEPFLSVAADSRGCTSRSSLQGHVGLLCGSVVSHSSFSKGLGLEGKAAPTPLPRAQLFQTAEQERLGNAPAEASENPKN